jgi:hypothetical protein
MRWDGSINAYTIYRDGILDNKLVLGIGCV